ncbi:MAG: hypothetical protein ACNS61_00150, partial [Candidatus Wenzhouxiangella sp. M2_3B_020]
GVLLDFCRSGDLAATGRAEVRLFSSPGRLRFATPAARAFWRPTFINSDKSRQKRRKGRQLLAAGTDPSGGS